MRVRCVWYRVVRTAAVAACAMLGACASRSPSPTADVAPSSSRTTRDALLVSLAHRQARTPDARAMAIPPLTGLDPQTFARSTSTSVDPRWVMPLPDAVASVPPLEPPLPSPDESDPRAVSLYASARLKLLNGKPAEALADLDAALRLDPGSGAIWRELGDAQNTLGRRATAITSYQRAVDRGVREPRVLLLLARDHARGGRHDRSIALLAAAHERESSTNGPLAPVLLAEMAPSFQELGYFTAARDALETALAGLADPGAGARSLPEIATLARRRGELWVRAGDLSVRLGDDTRAAAAYERAWTSPGIDPRDVLDRVIYLELRQGRSARAAMVLLSHLIDPDGRIDDRALPLLRLLAQQTDAGDAMAHAMEGLLSDAASAGTPTTRSRLARAGATSLPPARALPLLRTQALANPRDAETLIDLLAASGSGKGAVPDLLAIVTADPSAAGAIADAILAFGVRVDDLIAALASDSSPAGVLLHAALSAKLGLPARALDRLQTSQGQGDTRAALLAARAMLLLTLGDERGARDGAERFASMIAQDSSPVARRLLGDVWRTLGEHARALEAIAPAADAPDATPGLLLDAAEIAAEAGDGARTLEFLRRARLADRFDERVYDALLTLHAPGGLLADERLFAQAARDLREAVPSSRLVRVLTAQDFIARALWPQAQEQLLSLMDSRLEGGQALHLLTTVWERAAESHPDLTRGGRTWLAARLAERPQAPALRMALARVECALKNPHAAETLLAERLAVWPMPEMARLREWIVREHLHESARADALALDRLASAPPTFENAAERAELQLQRGDRAQAAEGMAVAVRALSTLNQARQRTVLDFLARIASGSQPTGDEARACLSLFEAAKERGLPMPTGLRLAQLSLLAGAAPDDPSALVRAATSLAADAPELLFPACVRIAAALSALDQPGPALRFLPAAAAAFTPPNDDLLHEWYRLSVVRGTQEDLERFLSTADASRMLTLIVRAGEEIELPDDRALHAVELNYAVANALSTLDRTDLAVWAYRRILRSHPEHGWTCNNLGYLLLEQGGDLNESDRLIAIAHRQLPDDYHVTDSLAWVRYKRGVLEDVTDAAGNVTTQGALSLLKLAVDFQGGNLDNTILDHYGDALWRAGRTKEAASQWTQARRLLEDTLAPWDMRKAAQPTLEDPPIVTRLRKDLEVTKAKLEAVAAGKEPAIAPLAEKP
ncbi:MAG: hypothetical protein HBSAPP03_16680 [Phycisphaerae bacterium]|nr:MAG: hypothetical protein HBSAPP03_16680 [Phycisphaerae bacterium]